MAVLCTCLSAKNSFLGVFDVAIFYQLLEGEVYHYHTKLMMKEPHTGGSFVWHQDYG